MPGSLKEETALLLEDYFQHRAGGAALPPSATAAELRRAAAELERRERPFFRSCAPLARAEPREAAALLRKVSAQLEADGGLNWGRLLALVVFAGTLAAALAESGCEEGPSRLAAALAAYLAEEQGEWLREHGGWVSGAGPRPGAGAARVGPPAPSGARGRGPGARSARRGPGGGLRCQRRAAPRGSPSCLPAGTAVREGASEGRRCQSLGWPLVPCAGLTAALGRHRSGAARLGGTSLGGRPGERLMWVRSRRAVPLCGPECAWERSRRPSGVLLSFQNWSSWGLMAVWATALMHVVV